MVIAGQLVISALIEHFGLFGMPKQPVQIAKLAGIGLVVAGVLVMQFAGEKSPAILTAGRKCNSSRTDNKKIGLVSGILLHSFSFLLRFRAARRTLQ